MDIQEQVMELALDQIREQALEVLQLRAMLEYAKAGKRAIKEELEYTRAAVEDLENEREELQDALSAAQASVEAYERREASNELLQNA